MAITAFSQKTLTERSITSGFELNKAVPGLTVTPSGGNPGVPSFAIRGRGLNNGAASGSVETYFAEVPLSGPFQAPELPPQFFDLESLQVLKGPQGTLFGRNTTGGAVLIVPQKPTDRFGGYGRLQGGTYGDFQFEGAINVPVAGDKAALRVAAFVWRRDGFMKIGGGGIDDLTGKALPEQTYDSHNERDIRATLVVRPTDDIENTTILTYHWSKERNSAGPYIELGFAGCPAPAIKLFACPTAPDSSAYTISSPGKGTRFQPSTQVNLDRPSDQTLAAINTTTVNLSDGITLRNIFGYIYAKSWIAKAQDVDGVGPVTTLDLLLGNRPSKNRQLTDELQLKGQAFDNRLSWIVGAIYDRTLQPIGADTINITSPIVIGPPTGVIGGNTTETFGADLLNQYSGFGSLTFSVTDRLKVTGGYRYTSEKIRSYGVASQPGYSGIVAPGPDTDTPLRRFNNPLRTTQNGSAYNAGVDFQATAQTLVYAAYRHGFKRGGFQTFAPSVSQSAYAGEKVDSFSAGLKTIAHVAGMPLRFNVEGYWDLLKNEQVSYLTLLVTPIFGIKGVTTNVPKSTYRGVDLDVTLEPASWLTLSGNYSYLDAYNREWTDNSTPGLTQNLAINPVAFAPRNKVSATGRMHQDVAQVGEFVLAVSVNHQDKVITSPIGKLSPFPQQVIFGNIDQISLGGATIPAYTTADIRVEWNRVADSPFSLALNITNLTNKLYYVGNNGNLGLGANGEDYAPPRMITFDVNYKF